STDNYTLSLHDALPIYEGVSGCKRIRQGCVSPDGQTVVTFRFVHQLLRLPTQRVLLQSRRPPSVSQSPWRASRRIGPALGKSPHLPRQTPSRFGRRNPAYDAARGPAAWLLPPEFRSL